MGIAVDLAPDMESFRRKSKKDVFDRSPPELVAVEVVVAPAGRLGPLAFCKLSPELCFRWFAEDCSNISVAGEPEDWPGPTQAFLGFVQTSE